MGAAEPLAERLRPRNMEDIVGQEHLLGKEGFLSKVVAKGRPLSILLWGPPGSGKTTIAGAYARAFNARLLTLSAVFSGVAEIKRIVQEAEALPLFQGKTVLFVDEIHRFNKSQQDAFLPSVERGTLVLVGATTENPSFTLNDALLSRLRVLTLKPLTEEHLSILLQRYEAQLGILPLNDEGRRFLLQMAQGDARHLFNLVENIQGHEPLDLKGLEKLLQKRSARFDRAGEGHYNLISALHKALRGSDPDAALYWFTRILEGGEDPLFIARRLIRVASEDVGLADPQALIQAIAARDAYQMLGSPEGELALAQVVIYLALAPKSNAVYTAYKMARGRAKETGHKDPPPHILNAPTALMKDCGYGKGYVYDHDTRKGCSGQNYFPVDMPKEQYYKPVSRGFEREMQRRLEYYNTFRKYTETD